MWNYITLDSIPARHPTCVQLARRHSTFFPSSCFVTILSFFVSYFSSSTEKEEKSSSRCGGAKATSRLYPGTCFISQLENRLAAGMPWQRHYATVVSFPRPSFSSSTFERLLVTRPSCLLRAETTTHPVQPIERYVSTIEGSIFDGDITLLQQRPTNTAMQRFRIRVKIIILVERQISFRLVCLRHKN